MKSAAYKAHIISTIVDKSLLFGTATGLQGSYNFYYCRCTLIDLPTTFAYKAHIISTIVDEGNMANLGNLAYKAHIISTIVDTKLTQ